MIKYDINVFDLNDIILYSRQESRILWSKGLEVMCGDCLGAADGVNGRVLLKSIKVVRGILGLILVWLIFLLVFICNFWRYFL